MTHFSENDQFYFAELTGDSNPLHVDAVAARRTQFGRRLVHGLHLLFYALEQAFANRQPSSIESIGCKFVLPVGVDETIEWKSDVSESNKLRLAIHSRGAECVKINVRLSDAVTDQCVWLDDAIAKENCQQHRYEDFNSLQGQTVLGVDAGLLACRFPNLATKLPTRQLAALLATTRIVGMQCPGLYSLFSELNLTFSAAAQSTSQLDWRVDSYDERFHRLSINLTAEGIEGMLIAFALSPPQNQPTSAELAGRVSPELYRGRRAWVIGGSRGIGELCAKLLAAGGAEVCLTYCSGSADALRVVGEISQAGGNAFSMAYDVLNPPASLDQQFGRPFVPTHIYYFATPAIFVGAKNRYSAELFHLFCRFYVDSFYSCYAKVREMTKDRIFLFYPSSVAVIDLQSSMGEYAAAKAAGEKLCQYLTTIDKKLDILVDRLPRLPSDQTLSIMDVKTDAPVDHLLRILNTIL